MLNTNITVWYYFKLSTDLSIDHEAYNSPYNYSLSMHALVLYLPREISKFALSKPTNCTSLKGVKKWTCANNLPHKGFSEI